MPQPQLISEGLILMTYGMGFVFCFLTLLVGATTLMSRIINRYFPQPIPCDEVKSVNDTELVAVISAAIHQYRSHRT